MKFLYLLLFLLFTSDAFSQPWFLPLNRELHSRYDHLSSDTLQRDHTTFKPYISNVGVTYDSLFDIAPYRIGRNNFIHRTTADFLNGHLIKIDTGIFYLTINPVFNFSLGREINEDRQVWTNTRGFWLNGAIGKKFAFHSSFFENQSVFPVYLDNFIRKYKVIPGQGIRRRFSNTGYDYNMASGYISWSPDKIFNIQFGHDKVFIGDGYRSLLLSDNSFNYPFLKITTTINRFQYINLFTQFQNITDSVLGTGYEKKYASFHYLSINFGKRLNVGLFESVIFQDRGFDVSYLNPIIFYRPVEFSLGSPDAVLMGLTWKYKFSPKIFSYGQFVLDDFKFQEVKKNNGFYQQKYALQVGLQVLNFITPWHNFRIEYNHARPYIYGHKLPAQNYSHYNQALAHPLGANFQELVMIDNYYYKRWVWEVRIILAKYGADGVGDHYGQDIFKSDYDIPNFPNSFGNYTGQGIKTNLLFINLQMAYVINPQTNMKAFVNYTHRYNFSSLINDRTNIFTAGIITDLRNHYYDF